jgi:hypothetical protein
MEPDILAAIDDKTNRNNDSILPSSRYLMRKHDPKIEKISEGM